MPREWNKEKVKEKPSFPRTIIRVHRASLAIVVLCSFFEVNILQKKSKNASSFSCVYPIPTLIFQAIFLIAPTFLVAKVSSYFDPKSTLTKSDTLLYGLGLFLSNMLYVLLRGYLYWKLMRIGADIQTGVSCLVYRKVRRFYHKIVFLSLPLLQLY